MSQVGVPKTIASKGLRGASGSLLKGMTGNKAGELIMCLFYKPKSIKAL